jgi:hypothetical protein
MYVLIALIFIDKNDKVNPIIFIQQYGFLGLVPVLSQ